MLEFRVTLSGGKLPELTVGQISKVTRSVASRVRAAVMRSTPKGDRPLGEGREKRTRQSWTAVKKDEGGYSFTNPQIQAWFLEHGSEIGSRPWPSVPEKKPRTVYYEGRVYSSQAPKGITAKAEVDFLIEQLSKQLIQALLQGKSLAKG